MKPWLLAVAVLVCLAASPPRPVVNALCRPGEGILFTFATASGKNAVLCVGPNNAYLVYRFGTDTKTELQYLTVLDGSSWQKFTYFHYTRGGGVANAGEEINTLSFENKGVAYQLYDNEFAFLTKKKEEDYRREVGVGVIVKGKTVKVAGEAESATGGLALSDEVLKRVKLDEDE